MVKKFQKGDFQKKDVNEEKNIKNYQIKKKDCYDVKDCFKLQLNLIPRLSLNMAKVLADKFENMNQLILYLKENGKTGLKDIEYPAGKGNRKIGVKMSEKIYESLI